MIGGYREHLNVNLPKKSLMALIQVFKKNCHQPSGNKDHHLFENHSPNDHLYPLAKTLHVINNGLPRVFVSTCTRLFISGRSGELQSGLTDVGETNHRLCWNMGYTMSSMVAWCLLSQLVALQFSCLNIWAMIKQFEMKIASRHVLG